MLTVNEKEFMWEQKYRPQSIAECILPAADKKVFEKLVKEGRIPHLILHSKSPGTGKTTVARALCEDIGVEYMFVNGADCKIDFVRGELTRFATAGTALDAQGKGKVIIIDEFDRAGLADSQRHLRSFMEAYSKNCTIIITANNLEGIIQPLRSRARVIHFAQANGEDAKNMMREMIKRTIEICKVEDIPADVKVLAALVQSNFPDFRKTINDLDMYSKNGAIDEGILSIITNTRDPLDDVIDLIKGKNVKGLRAIAPKYTGDYSAFVEKLADELYNRVEPLSILRMYEIVGENNQYLGLAGSVEIHLVHLLLQLAVELKFK